MRLPIVYIRASEDNCCVLAAGSLRKNVLSLQVLVIEPTKVYQPAYVSINNEADERSLSLWHVSPTEMVKLPADVFHVF